MAWVPWAQMMVTPLDRAVHASSVPLTSRAAFASGNAPVLRRIVSRAPEGVR